MLVRKYFNYLNSPYVKLLIMDWTLHVQMILPIVEHVYMLVCILN